MTGPEPPVELPDGAIESDGAASHPPFGESARILDRLLQIMIELGAPLDLDARLAHIVTAAAEILDAETGSLLLADEETNELTFEAVTGEPGQEAIRYRVPPGRGIAGWVVERAEAVIVNDPSDDPRFYRAIDRSTGFGSHTILAVPIIIRSRVIGVLEVINSRHAAGFDASDLRIARALASQAALAIDNANLYARVADIVIRPRLAYRL